MAGKSSNSKDDCDKPSTSGGLKRNKRKDVNQNVSTATENEVEMVSSKAKRSRELTGEELHALCDRHNYFANYPDNIKKKAREVLRKTYESEGEKVMDLFQALKIKPRFKELPCTTITEECLISVEMDCDCEFYEFYIVAFKSDIHAEILLYFHNMLVSNK